MNTHSRYQRTKRYVDLPDFRLYSLICGLQYKTKNTAWIVENVYAHYVGGIIDMKKTNTLRSNEEHAELKREQFGYYDFDKSDLNTMPWRSEFNSAWKEENIREKQRLQDKTEEELENQDKNDKKNRIKASAVPKQDDKQMGLDDYL